MPHATITEVPLAIAGALVGRAASNWGWRNRHRLGAYGDPLRVTVVRLEALCGPIPADRIEALAGKSEVNFAFEARGQEGADRA